MRDEDEELTAYEQAHMLAGALLMAFRKMSPEQRLKIFEEIEDGYCPFCGHGQPMGHPCQCWNDD